MAILLTLPATRSLGMTDDCQDPSKLSEDMRQAYEQLKELEKEIEGFSVSIRCTERIGHEKNSGDRQDSRTRPDG